MFKFNPVTTRTTRVISSYKTHEICSGKLAVAEWVGVGGGCTT